MHHPHERGRGAALEMGLLLLLPAGSSVAVVALVFRAFGAVAAAAITALLLVGTGLPLAVLVRRLWTTGVDAELARQDAAADTRSGVPAESIELELKGARDRLAVMEDVHAEATRAAAARDADIAQARSDLAAAVERAHALQRELVETRRMAAIGTLAAGIAHEIKDPLSYVLANVAFAADQLRSSTDLAEIVRALDDSREGAQRVAQIAHDLKTLAGADSAAGSGPVDVRKTLVSALNLAQHVVKDRARLVFACREIPPVTASEARLGQIFLGLIANAVRSLELAGREGEIRVATRTDAEGRAVIEVVDDGVGVPGEGQPGAGSGPGPGLELAVCRALVAELGGRMEAESELGRGSRFQVTFPPAAAPPPRAAAVPSSAPAPSSSIPPATFLVVDDEPGVCRGITRILRGHQVIAVTSAAEALGQLQAGVRPDVVISDVMMPGMNGIAFYAQVRQRFPNVADRFVFLTGGALTPALQAAVERCALPVLQKPFTGSELRAALAWARARGPWPGVAPPPSGDRARSATATHPRP